MMGFRPKIPPAILLVEDDVIDTEAVRRALRRAAIDNPLHIARDGVEALETLRTLNQPCLMLVDINMPRMNGLQLLQELRKDPDLRQNVVFMLSTSALGEDKISAYKLNAAGYILKENILRLGEMIRIYFQVNEFPSSPQQAESLYA